MRYADYAKKKFNNKWVVINLQTSFPVGNPDGNDDEDDCPNWTTEVCGKMKAFDSFVSLTGVEGAELIVKFEDIVMISQLPEPDELERSFKLYKIQKKQLSYLEKSAKRINNAQN